MPHNRCEIPKISRWRCRDVNRHVRMNAVYIYRWTSILPYMETSYMEIERVQKPCKRVAHRSGQNSSAAPASSATRTSTKCSIMCCLRKATYVPSTSPKDTTAQPADKPAQASSTKALTAEPIDKPGTERAAESPATTSNR